MTSAATTAHYLTYSDGSETDSTPEYGIAYVGDATQPDVWTWDESLGTADQATALAIVADRGYTATAVPGGWYGDSRDDSYRLDAMAQA